VLDFTPQYDAFQRRDPAFDGVVFVAVKTTGIYCRPVCRVRTPLAQNVEFYPSAAAAERAGYRPCLRCRPETAPFCAAWKGTRTTVERALRLIEAGALDREGVDALAERLGLGQRHLSRLFAQHLDASPLQVARSLRVQRAKRLLSDTDLPVTLIAQRAGFQSARRMNAAFTRLYGQPPTALRNRRSAHLVGAARDERMQRQQSGRRSAKPLLKGGPQSREVHMVRAVPVIDIRGFAEGDETARAAIAREVSSALSEIGFLVLRGHGVSPATISALRDAAWRFFDLPPAEKERSRKPMKGAWRGYVTAEDENLSYMQNENSPPDLKEFFGFGQFGRGDEPYYRQPFADVAFPPNIWPNQPADFKPAAMRFYREMEELTERLLRVFEQGLGLDPGFFRDKFNHHASTVRLLNYPNQIEEPLQGQLRCAAHYDFTAFTLLTVDDAPGGLQVQSRSGEWVDIPSIRDGIVLNVGDLMAGWTNDRWRSGLHRVLNPPRDARGSTRRLSLVYFVNPNYDALVECLPSCQDADHPALYPPVKAGEHRLQKVLIATSDVQLVAAAT
jgi:isopenicillin N synthase-like dioxygenase/methylphosphotriester-DNA--protein-cysteine methyltransferase